MFNVADNNISVMINFTECFGLNVVPFAIYININVIGTNVLLGLASGKSFYTCMTFIMLSVIIIMLVTLTCVSTKICICM